ncbi:hypothetical protein ACIQPR_43515 [Streptomyces sp. NPDC091280]|uniref:hypothetical protein n=1 Tax=Streptomyces sp. NPDC091280 TaxID=3365984 RepID=UPI0037FFBBA2
MSSINSVRAHGADVYGRRGERLINKRKAKKRGTMAARLITRGLVARVEVKAAA